MDSGLLCKGLLTCSYGELLVAVVVPSVCIGPSARVTNAIVGSCASIGDDVAIVRDSIIDAGTVIESALLDGVDCRMHGRRAWRDAACERWGLG